MEPETLLQLPEGARGPDFSPDGAWLAYVQGGVCVRPLAEILSAIGEPRRLGAGRTPRFEPTGADHAPRRAVTFLRGNDTAARVWRRPLDSTGRPEGGPIPITPEGLAVREFAWAPDGRTLAVISAAGVAGQESPLRFRPGALWLVDAATGAAHERLAMPANEAPRRLAWSPDGRHLAWEALCTLEDRFETVREVRLLPVTEGTARRVVPTGACQTALPGWPDLEPGSPLGVWRPDGRALALGATPHPYGLYAVFGLAV